jgi:hypothetical protein
MPPNTIQPDHADLRAVQIREAHAATAREIHERHEQLMQKGGNLRDAMVAHCEEAIRIARLVEAMHAQLGGRRFADWWHEQRLPVGWAERYMRLAHTAERNTLGDKDQLRLIGILPEAEAGSDPQKRQEQNPYEWVKLTGRLTAVLTPEAIRSMGEVDRRVALQKLEPMKRVIAELEAACA